MRVYWLLLHISKYYWVMSTKWVIIIKENNAKGMDVILSTRVNRCIHNIVFFFWLTNVNATNNQNVFPRRCRCWTFSTEKLTCTEKLNHFWVSSTGNTIANQEFKLEFVKQRRIVMTQVLSSMITKKRSTIFNQSWQINNFCTKKKMTKGSTAAPNKNSAPFALLNILSNPTSSSQPD